MGCFADDFFNRLVTLLQGGYFFMLKTIIITKKAKQIMYSKQSPPLIKGAKTAAAVSLHTNYITIMGNLSRKKYQKN